MRATTLGLLGSPNSGKTSLFNALTNSRQKTGNYAGVTVERKEGDFELDGRVYRLVDLPGTYSLEPQSPDEALTLAAVEGTLADQSPVSGWIAVADCTNLERSLYLVLQLKELGVPFVLALTMSDLAHRRGVRVRTDVLARELGVPVVLVSATKKSGLRELLEITAQLAGSAPDKRPAGVNRLPKGSTAVLARYVEIERILKLATEASSASDPVTKKLDRFFLHPVLGPVILVAAFTLMFQSVFTFAEFPKGLIESAVQALQAWLGAQLADGWARSLLLDGILAGVGSVLVFLPQIVILFSFILLFEDTGYLARAAVLLDRLMARFGLGGRSFIPLLSSFACAIPGIMATRTIAEPRDRLLTILVAPFMTCSARLPIYTLLISAFVPHKTVLGVFQLQGLAMTGLYLLGIACAILVSFFLRKTKFRGSTSSVAFDLPTYKAPHLRNLALGLWDRARVFLAKAGTVILSLSVVLWFLASYPKVDPPPGLSARQAASYQLEHSFSGRIGKSIEPVIAPLGFDWRIGIALLSSFAAREVVVSALGTVYAVEDTESDAGKASLTEQLANHGFSLATALSLMVFYALACQCMSTLAVVRRETNSLRWPVAMFAYMTVLAYSASWLTYQVATLSHR